MGIKMSISLPSDFWQTSALSCFEKLTLLYLKEHDVISAKELAINLNVSDITMRRALAKLRKTGLLPKHYSSNNYLVSKEEQ